MIRLLDLHIQRKKKNIPGKLAYDCPPGCSSKKIQFQFVLALANYLGGKSKVTTAYQQSHIQLQTLKLLFHTKLWTSNKQAKPKFLKLLNSTATNCLLFSGIQSPCASQLVLFHSVGLGKQNLKKEKRLANLICIS